MSDIVNNFIGPMMGYTGAPLIDSSTNNVTATSNTGGSATNLMAYSLQPSVLNTNQGFKIAAAGTTAANANAKSFSITFGGTTIASISGTFNNLPWRIEADGYKISNTSQIWSVKTYTTSPVVVALTSVSTTVDLTAVVVTQCVGTGVATNDITQTILAVSFD